MVPAELSVCTLAEPMKVKVGIASMITPLLFVIVGFPGTSGLIGSRPMAGSWTKLIWVPVVSLSSKYTKPHSKNFSL